MQLYPAVDDVPHYALKNNHGFKTMLGVLFCGQSAVIITGWALQSENVESP